MYFVYILLSKRYNKTYTGITDNLDRRLKEHNEGSGIFSKRYRPWKILYSEIAKDRLLARKREKYLKSAAG